MLEQTDFRLHAISGGNRCSTQTAKQMNTADERLVAGKTEGDIRREIVIGLAGTLTERVTIYESHVDIRIPLATHKGVVVGKITGTGRDINIDRNTIVVVILIILVSHLPRITADDTVECLYRTNDTCQKLTPEPGTTPLAVVKNKVGDTIGHLTYTYSSHRRGDKVVDCRRLYLAGSLPHERTAERIRY